MKSETYQKLASVAVFSVPVAPAAFLGLRLFAQGKAEAVELFNTTNMTAVYLMLALAAAVTAAGLELVGILSGHVTAKLYQRQDKRWLLTAAALGGYTLLGWSALRGTAGAFAFLIAPLIYLVAAINTAADEQHEEEQQQAAAQATDAQRLADEQREFEREQQRLRLGLERELALSREEHDHRLKLAQAEQQSRERIARAEARAHTAPAPAALSPAQSRYPGNFPAQQPRSEPESRQASAPSTAPATLVCAGCGYEAAGINALKGHQRWCVPYKTWKEAGEMPEVMAVPTAPPSSNGYH